MAVPKSGPNLFDAAVLTAVLWGFDWWREWHLSVWLMVGGPSLGLLGWSFVRGSLRRGAKPTSADGGETPIPAPDGALVLWGRRMVPSLVDLAVAGIVGWFYLGLSGGAGILGKVLVLMAVGGLGGALARWCWSGPLQSRAWWITGAVAAGFVTLLCVAGSAWRPPLTWGTALYLAAAGLLIRSIWHVTADCFEPRPTERWRENLRLLALLATALFCFSPFLVPMLVGGLDARWYGLTMVDALAQARASEFPVWVGQGEFMFNGAIHPFRTAPFHYYFAILLDLITLRSLSPLALQHFTLVAIPIQMGFLSYAGLAALAPGRRTAAALLAGIFLTAPLLVAYVFAQEMYMTAMAFGFLPVVLWANLQALERSSPVTLGLLAAGLASVWMCHAPVAMWASLITLFMQCARLLTWDWVEAAWRQAVGWGAGFIALSAYYFISITELPSPKTGGAGGMLFVVAVALLGFGGLVRFLATRNVRWFGVAAVGTMILLFVHFIYGVWLLAAMGLALALLPLPGSGFPVWRLASAVLLGALVAARFVPDQYQQWELATFVEAASLVRANFPGAISPVSSGATAFSDLQLGYSCWLLLAAGLVAGWRRSSRQLQVAGLVAAGLALLSLPLPGINAALLSLIPQQIYAVNEIVIGLRYLPVLGGLAVFVGGTALMRYFPREREPFLLAVLALMLVWNLTEARKFVIRGRAAVSTPAATAAFLRPENAPVYSYGYNNMPMPSYVVNGVVDPLLESRLLRPGTGKVIPDPLLNSAPLFTRVLAVRPDRDDPRWLHLEPKLILEPGERLALEFQFARNDYEGTLVFRGNRGFYRDYALPDSGNGANAFGVRTGQPKTLAVWNSTAQAEELELLYLQAAAPLVTRPPTIFATVRARHYSPESLQVKTLGLVPFRAEVTTDQTVLLETPRVFIPGYRATLNGQAAAVVKSPENLVAISVPPGKSTVVLEFVGTPRLKLALALSAVAWVALVVAGLMAGRRWYASRPRPPPL